MKIEYFYDKNNIEKRMFRTSENDLLIRGTFSDKNGLDFQIKYDNALGGKSWSPIIFELGIKYSRDVKFVPLQEQEDLFVGFDFSQVGANYHIGLRKIHFHNQKPAQVFRSLLPMIKDELPKRRVLLENTDFSFLDENTTTIDKSVRNLNDVGLNATQRNYFHTVEKKDDSRIRDILKNRAINGKHYF